MYKTADTHTHVCTRVYTRVERV